MKSACHFLPLLGLLLFAACGEQAAEIRAPKNHLSHNLSFQYPGNWKVTEDKREEGYHYIFVESPGSAIAIIQIVPEEDSPTLQEHARSFSSDAVEAMTLGSMSQSKFEDLSKEGGFERIKDSFDISLLGQMVPHQRLHLARVFGKQKVFLTMQVAVEDLGQVGSGFDLISQSLEMKPPQ